MAEYKNILVTGATGFIGSYFMRLLESEGYKPDYISRRPDATIACDLEKDIPLLSRRYDVVVHMAGTADDSRADVLNNIGTRHLLEGLENVPPRQIIYISTVHVYGNDPGEDVEESCFLRPDTPYSRSKIRAEKTIEKWCADHGVLCTILRPASVIGNGMHGRYAFMADSVSKGYYMHIRGNEAKRNLVMADDLAAAIRLCFGVPGVYNVTDGLAHGIVEIADAMAANFATNKRILSLPKGLIKWGLRLCPSSKLKEMYKALTTTATFSNKKLTQTIDFKPYNAVEVMARRQSDYPYMDKPQDIKP
ncbi:MAG: NAD(P)-dependent oxidoreductase [Muribaculaceae bacterium]|nr:NAD(P)-dependent oxidoreductase [Muribaculaceae bacterium]